MNFIESVKDRVKNNPKKTIILTESNDNRVLEAIKYILDKDLANIILLGRLNNTNYKLNNLKIVIPEESELLDRFTIELYNLRNNKGLTIEEARKLLCENYMYFACMLLKFNLADGVVSGASHTTSDTIRPALQILDKSSLLASTFMLMEIDNFDNIFLFSDIALNINPSSEELSNIAIDSCLSYKKILNIEPKAAMLSYSTYSSAKGDSVDKIKKSIELCKVNRPDLIIDGEMQLDSAIIPSVNEIKAPNSIIKGDANILIFPDLNAGNIGYKLVNRFSNSRSYGPFIQGLNKTVSDLSRGSNTEEIIGTILITCLLTV